MLESHLDGLDPCWMLDSPSVIDMQDRFFPDPLYLESSTFLHDSLVCLPAVYMLGSHSELNHHFLPNRSQSKQPVWGPDEGIILAKMATLSYPRLPHMFKLDSILQQVGFFSGRILHFAPCLPHGKVCVCMCVPRGEVPLAKEKNLVWPISRQADWTALLLGQFQKELNALTYSCS